MITVNHIVLVGPKYDQNVRVEIEFRLFDNPVASKWAVVLTTLRVTVIEVLSKRSPSQSLPYIQNMQTQNG